VERPWTGARNLQGHYLSAAYERTEIEVAKKLLLSVNGQLFYINYTDNNVGLFITAKISATVKNIPLLLYFHVIQFITSNFKPFPGFKFNVGLAYVL